MQANPAQKRVITRDDAREVIRNQRRMFAKAKRAELQYGRQLRGVAHQVSRIVRGYATDPKADDLINEALKRYAQVIQPWARATAAKMLADVARRDRAAWAEQSKLAGRELHREIVDTPVGDLLHALLEEQVTYITSLPLDEAERVHEWTLKGLEDSGRAAEVSNQIMRTGEVTKGRANLIARTEVARTASALTQARATHIGSEGYIWRTSGDSDVRPEHRKLNGKFFRWDDPPRAGTNGMKYHAGQGPNCRCYPEVVIPDDL